MSTGFDARSLTQSYAFLDDCPEELIPLVVPMAIGTLEQRVEGVNMWRESLLQGRLPTEKAWPGPKPSAAARASLSELGLLRFCRDNETLVDQLLPDLLDSFSQQDKGLKDAVAEELRRLEELERRRRRERETRNPEKLPRKTIEDLQSRAEASVQPSGRCAHIVGIWADRARIWNELADVFDDLGDLTGLGWDMSRGVLQHHGWTEVKKLQALLKKLPELRELIRQLGRLQLSDEADSCTNTIFEPMLRMEEELREVTTPHVPAEMRGVERSGKIERMLPSEAAMLGHPKLRLLWHARRAERALMTYRVQGIERYTELVESHSMVEKEEEGRRLQRGPIAAVVDTSGSMSGLPEVVAKALVLEAMRTARKERRRCYLFSYSGPGQVHQQELDLGPDGIGALLNFLSMSFGGGTDIAAIREVVTKLGEPDWQKADVLLLSDGEWQASSAILSIVDRAKEAGTRFHGVQIGSMSSSMAQVCDPNHRFSDWSKLAGWNSA